jgi:hypothetical protein
MGLPAGVFQEPQVPVARENSERPRHIADNYTGTQRLHLLVFWEGM